MRRVEWRSSWVAADGGAPITECETPGSGAPREHEAEGIVRLETSIASPVVLTCPPPVDDEQSAKSDRAQLPCELTVKWTPTPRRCRSLRLEVAASARHVELFVEGTRRNLLGEREYGEVYFGTFRGARSDADPQRFVISEQFDELSDKHSVLGSLSLLRVKFVSLVGNKRELQLHSLRCEYDAVPDAPPVSTAPAAPLSSDVASALGSLNLGGEPVSVNSPSITPGGINSIQLLLATAQQQMMQQLESRIAGAMDAKLALLSQRLASSEQQIFKLHQRIDSTDSEQKANVGRLQDRLASLEVQLSALGKTGSLASEVQQQQPAE